MPLPVDYAQRVYAGVLGKVIGVYLGRPFEGWWHRDILAKLGEVDYYVHERLNVPLVVTDDDISGTFTFVRALEDYGYSKGVTAEQIGRTWLNYIIENKTILWWGGVGMSTEHTAFKRLRDGIPAPRSGSIALNGKVVAEQIGSQIFIDGWGMVAPGDPALAADLARRAASVSHDGEAIYGAQVIAAVVAAAFVEKDLDRLLDTALSFVPRDSVTARMIGELRAYRAEEADWRKCFADVLQARYGYDRYGGNCHVIPNHGVVILALLYGGGDFQRSLMIANTCGWDTDCNSGNVGAILGVLKGLAGIDAGPDFRGPVADRMYLPTADGGRCITDALAEAYRLVYAGRALAGEAPEAPKGGARFHFSLPGSVQGFMPERSIESGGTTSVGSVTGPDGLSQLSVRYAGLARGRVARAATATFTSPDTFKAGTYAMVACPTLYPGQTVRASVVGGEGNAAPAEAKLYVRHYNAKDELDRVSGPATRVAPGAAAELTFRVGDVGGYPIAEVGIEVSGEGGASGELRVDRLTWDGAPDVTLRKPAGGGDAYCRAWVEGVSGLMNWGDRDLRLVQNDGRGIAIQGTREWRDYRVSTEVTVNLARAVGLAARVQGMRRYYAILLTRAGQAQLVKVLDGERVLASAPFALEYNKIYRLGIAVSGGTIEGFVDDEVVLRATDHDQPLLGGAAGLVIEEGRMDVGPVRIQPA